MTVRLAYLLTDVSGSTVRAGFNTGWHRALPEIVSVLEEAPVPARLCVLSYATEAELRVPLTRVEDLTLLPPMPAGGLSAMAAGLRLLARTLAEDREQLDADRVPVDATGVLVFADGLSTDLGENVVAARRSLDPAAPPGTLRVHVAFPAGIDPLAVAGLDATPHLLATGDPVRVAASMVSAARSALAGTGA